MSCMVSNNASRLVAEKIAQHSPLPTDLLALLEGQLSYGEIQDAIADLLDHDQIVLDADRHLRMKNAA